MLFDSDSTAIFMATSDIIKKLILDLERAEELMEHADEAKQQLSAIEAAPTYAFNKADHFKKATDGDYFYLFDPVGLQILKCEVLNAEDFDWQVRLNSVEPLPLTKVQRDNVLRRFFPNETRKWTS